MQGTKNLTKGPINRQLFNLAMPIMATSFIQMAYSLTDMAWVGRIGSEAVAAVGAVGILTWMSGSIALLNKSRFGSQRRTIHRCAQRTRCPAVCFAQYQYCLAHLHLLGCFAILVCQSHPTYIRAERTYHGKCRDLLAYCLNRTTVRVSVRSLHWNIQCGGTK